MKLKEYGFILALDNFVSGYSTLSHFYNMSAKMINIEKTFIDNIEVNKYNEYIVKMIIELSHMNGVKVLAKGVETFAQYELLKGLDCDAIQGYYFAKPLIEHDALEYILKMMNL